MKPSIFLFFMCCFFAVVDNHKIIDRRYFLSLSKDVVAQWTLGGSLQPWFINNTTRIQVLLSTNTTICTNPGSFPSFHLGFYGDFGDNRLDSTFVLAVFMGVLDSQYKNTSPVVVWSANQDHPVDVGATLDLTAKGGLVLNDVNGQEVWAADTLGRSVRSMNLTCHGNLVLLSDKGEIVWQSFDYPTDTWLPGQSLQFGQRLTSRASSHNWETGKFYLSIGNDSPAFVDSNPPIEYGYFYLSTVNYVVSNMSNSKASYSDMNDINVTYIRLDPNGHLNLYTYNVNEIRIADLLLLPSSEGAGPCAYPSTCGNYGICFNDHACDCPDQFNGNFNYFKPVDESAPELGCHPVTKLSCEPYAHEHHTFLELESVTYFGFESYLAEVHDIDSCKIACLKICSCKAALFRYTDDLSSGNCSLPSQLLTLRHIEPVDNYHHIAFIKVQRPAGEKSSSLIVKLVPSISAGLFIVLCIGVWCFLRRKKNEKDKECPSDMVINTVARFSFESLRLATKDFQNRLGRGGFGAVFEGTLDDGSRVAVKRLNSSGQTRKEFLAEVNTIGNLHHYNLVRLIGFCDSESNRLLVYEYMPNGSLEKWIFNEGLAPSLPWHLRKRIIEGIAKGLEYLHENCMQTVIHFDIKPQNILLDSDFNAKISDFGLAKAVDRDQSQVVTVIRGTPGYIAPELITAQIISVKLDVYSFGVLVLEILCGRKNFSSSYGDLLTDLVKIKVDENKLSDLIDERAEDMQLHKEEALKMMKIAIWCLQPHMVRPSMSMAVNVLQDFGNMDTLGDLNFLTMVHEAAMVENGHTFSTRPIESVLSQPR